MPRKSRNLRAREIEEKGTIILCRKCGAPAVYERIWRIGSDARITLPLHCTDCGCCMWCCPSFHQVTYWIPSRPGPGVAWQPPGSDDIRNPARRVLGAEKTEKSVHSVVFAYNATLPGATGRTILIVLQDAAQHMAILKARKTCPSNPAIRLLEWQTQQGLDAYS